MRRTTTIELEKERMKFSAGHFTIFSATERENLHGHNFHVRARIEALVGEDGLAFDYGVYKKRLQERCDALDEVLLLPEKNPHLRIEAEAGRVRVRFAEEELTFLERDVKLLPVRNITLEELSAWLLEGLLEGASAGESEGVVRLEIGVSSGAGQWGSTEWIRPKDPQRAQEEEQG